MPPWRNISVATLGELWTWGLRANAPARRLTGLANLLSDVIVLDATRKRKPEALAQDVLRDLIEQFTDEELLERSSAAARRASIPIEESEDVVRHYRWFAKRE